MKDRRRRKRREGEEAVQNCSIAATEGLSAASAEWTRKADRYYTRKKYDVAAIAYDRAGNERRARLARAFCALQIAEDTRDEYRRWKAFEDAVSALLDCADETTPEDDKRTLVEILAKLGDCFIELRDDEGARVDDPLFLSRLGLISEGPESSVYGVETTSLPTRMPPPDALDFDRAFDRWASEEGVRNRGALPERYGPKRTLGRLVRYKPVFAQGGVQVGGRVAETTMQRRPTTRPTRASCCPSFTTFLLLACIATATLFLSSRGQ